MGDDLIRGYLSELDAALAVASGPARAHAAIVAEIGDGLTDAVADRLDHGDPPHEAARRAVEDFGAATAVAAEFIPILAAAQVHRCALASLRAGPLVGVLWLTTVLLAASRGLPLGSPVVIVAGTAVAAAIVAAVPCMVFAVTVTGCGCRRWTVPPIHAVDAARVAAGTAILVDVILLLALSTQAATVLAGRSGAVLAGLAAVASLVRLTVTAHGTIRLRRTRALLATAHAARLGRW